MKRVTYILLLFLAVGCGRRSAQQTLPAADSTSIYHQWRELGEKDYLFYTPTPEQIESWKALCEKRNDFSREKKTEVPDYYKSMSQYVTLWDFARLWWDDNDPLTADCEIALWRLSQYDTVSNKGVSEREKFVHLHSLIEELCDFDPQFGFEYSAHACFNTDFQEFYTRFLTRETISHSPVRISQALEKEDKAWHAYHKEFDEGFHIFHDDPSGLGGNTEPRAGLRIVSDDARIRAASLEDYYFTLRDGTAQIQIYNRIPIERVVREYDIFIRSIEDDEFHSPLTERQQVLRDERTAWLKWMKSRETVSSMLSGICKTAYDNATNNARRMKLIMLKNCYEGYGVTSQEVIDHLIPYDAKDDLLEGPNFNEKWKMI